MMTPKLSIVLPVFNAEPVLAGCLESLTQLDRQDALEVLLVDGGSSDGTLAVASRFTARLPGLRVISEPDQGVYDAMNKGMIAARGDWLFFLGADDRLGGGPLWEMLAKAEAAGAAVLQGDVVLANTGVRLSRTMTPARLFTGEVFCHQACCYRRFFFPDVRYRLDYPIAADQLFNWQWMVSRRAPLLHIHEVLALYANTGMSAVRQDEAWARDQAAWHGRIFPSRVVARRKRWMPVEKWGRKILRYFIGRDRAKQAQLRLQDWLYADAAG